MSLRFTLRADGPTDCMLMPIIRWALLKQLPAEEIHGQFANPKSLPRGSSSKLDRSIRAAVDFFPCDVLFIHRDAENELPAKRLEEIKKATEYPDVFSSPFVPVIPVRMSEAWLLIDERAIRRAAGNPNGKIHIALPSIKNLEKLPDPKQELRAILKSASGLGGRGSYLGIVVGGLTFPHKLQSADALRQPGSRSLAGL